MNDFTSELDNGYQILVMGGSLGGLDAIRAVLGELSSDFQLPIVVCRHRASGGEGRLEHLCRVPGGPTVVEVEDKQALRGGCVYMAPPDYHTLVGRGELSLSTEEPVCWARPSIDVLFESAADAYGPGVIGVLMTGASDDGARGLATIKQRGGCTIVQDPRSAVAPTMPRSALEITEVDAVLDLAEIGPFLVEMTGGRRIGR